MTIQKDKILVTDLKFKGKFIKAFNSAGEVWFVYELDGKQYVHPWRLSHANQYADVYEI